MNADFEVLKNINEIGEKIAKSLIEYFSNEENISLINKLKDIGVNTINNAIKEIKDTLKDKRFVITGSFESFSRDGLTELIENHGGVVVSSVSKNLDYLIVGDKPGSKLEKAEKIISIKIIDENGFWELIK
jgi:DNA ligase (NAD+)